MEGKNVVMEAENDENEDVVWLDGKKDIMVEL